MEQTISIREASRKYRIPLSTVQDWAREGRVETVPGPNKRQRQLIVVASLKQTIKKHRQPTLKNSRTEIIEQLRSLDPEMVLNLKEASEASGISHEAIKKYCLGGVIKFCLGELNNWGKPTFKIRAGDLLCFVENYEQTISSGKPDTNR